MKELSVHIMSSINVKGANGMRPGKKLKIGINNSLLNIPQTFYCIKYMRPSHNKTRELLICFPTFLYAIL